ncbi:hypothetical protein GCM10011583_32410 [Streptomyces camponoticapitis]|uniref:HTH luxR-type domain-containing protein n=1 Tax=Streptomyces camponoticapitis TaxID=1616125 RepID=A0ABQ2E752_9ACTN|nr:hypothetical protein GCM10011583_32410 [Streptomyces camponoticapitis]
MDDLLRQAHEQSGQALNEQREVAWRVYPKFLDALERVAAGRAAFDPEVVRQLLARSNRTDPLSRLTEREREVLAEMAQGHTNTAVVRRLHISVSAVEKHCNAIFDKLEIRGTVGYSRRVLAVLRYLN